jgi:DNA-binding XRE family transcriptional regulator
VKELARRLGVSRATIYRMEKRGRITPLEGVKRYEYSAVLAALRRNRRLAL